MTSESDRRPRIFLGARAALEPVLARGGYELALESYDHTSFGSAFAEYRRRGGRVRLIWEGKSAALWAEVAPPHLDHWRELETAAAARASAAADEGVARVSQLHRVLDRLVSDTPARP